MSRQGRGVVVVASVLCIVAALAALFPSAAPAAVPVEIAAFATQTARTEEKIPNFWGPPVEAARQERYTDAPDGTRTVQYFEKARMELAPAGVTNGLLTVELITGQRQFGDTRFGSFAPSALSIVGDTDNPWPPYKALGAKVFPENVPQSDERITIVYKADGTFTHDAKLGAKPGAAAGGYVTDPGGRFAHNIPAAFWPYLHALPGA